MRARKEVLRVFFFVGMLLTFCPNSIWSQVYNEEQKSTFIYPINSGWNMMSQDLKREYLGNSTLPTGIQIGNIIGANIQIKNDLNGSGTSTFSSTLYRLNDQGHGTNLHGGRFHVKCDNYPQCEAWMFGYWNSIQGGTSFFRNANYDSPTNPRGFIKLEYLNSGTTSNTNQANDYYFPIGGWNMHTNLNQSQTRSVAMTGIDINNIASISASIYSDPVNNQIEIRNFEQRGKPDLPVTPGVIFRGGLLHVSNVGPNANLRVVGTPSNFSQINGNNNSSMFSHGGYTQTGSNRGWIKVTVSGTSTTLQPYAIKSKIMQIGGWPIVSTNGTAQPHKNLTFSTLGIAANRIVHAEALIFSDPDPGSSSQVRTLTNLMRLNFTSNIKPDGGLFIIQPAQNRIHLVAMGSPNENPPHHFNTNHSDPNINRGWFQVDYLAAQCNEGSGYTRTFIGPFSPDANDCHGNNGSGSSAVHVIQTKAPDIWNTSDQFTFVNKSRNATNTMIKARIDKIENTNSWARAGLMIRATLGANSRHVAMVVTPKPIVGNGNGIGLTWRTSDGGSTSESSPNTFSAPYWVLIRKDGTNFRGYISTTGTGDPVTNPGSWAQVGNTISISNFPSNYFVGLCQTAGNNSPSNYNTSVYSNLNF